MNLSVINKYVLKKEKNLLGYAKILEGIIGVEANKMWKSKKAFAVYAEGILQRYTALYYFQNNKHRDNPIEYANDNINFVLKSIIEYCQEEKKMDMLSSMKNETFLLSVIICTSCYLDIATNAIDGDIKSVKNKFKYLLEYFAKTKILKVKNNKDAVETLFAEVEKNLNTDTKVLNAFESELYGLTMKMVSNNPLYYLVNFHYRIPGLDGYDKRVTDKLLDKYQGSLIDLELTLLDYYILRELISNRDMPKYLIRINRTMKKISVSKFFYEEYIKDFVEILIPWEEKDSYEKTINGLEKNNVGVIYEYLEDDKIDSSTFIDNSRYLVSRKFLVNNLENKSDFEARNITLIVKNKEEE